MHGKGQYRSEPINDLSPFGPHFTLSEEAAKEIKTRQKVHFNNNLVLVRFANFDMEDAGKLPGIVYGIAEKLVEPGEAYPLVVTPNDVFLNGSKEVKQDLFNGFAERLKELETILSASDPEDIFENYTEARKIKLLLENLVVH